MPEYYTYGYRVYEPKAGEFKDHKEFRDGGLIYGYLKVVEKSGAKTNITYEGLPWSGWQALIETQDSYSEKPANDTGQTSTTTLIPAKLTSNLDSTESTTSEASSKQTSTDASSKQTSTEASSKYTISVDFGQPTAETSSKQTTAEAASKKTPTITIFMQTSEPSTKPWPSGSTLSSKMARFSSKMTHKPWIQMYRICPTTDPSLIKTPNSLGQVAQSNWHNPQSPQPEKLGKSSWKNHHHQMFPMRPSNGHMSTEHAVFPVLHQPFRHEFSARQHPHRQPSESLLKPTSAPERKFPIHHEKTAWERRHHPRYQRRSNLWDRDVSNTIYVK